jgi:hypothetical protein
VDIQLTTEFDQGKQPMIQASTQPQSHRQQEQTGTAVERIAAFAAAVWPEQMTSGIRHLFKRAILWTALAAPSRRCRDSPSIGA